MQPGKASRPESSGAALIYRLAAAHAVAYARRASCPEQLGYGGLGSSLTARSAERAVANLRRHVGGRSTASAAQATRQAPSPRAEPSVYAPQSRVPFGSAHSSAEEHRSLTHESCSTSRSRLRSPSVMRARWTSRSAVRVRAGQLGRPGRECPYVQHSIPPTASREQRRVRMSKFLKAAVNRRLCGRLATEHTIARGRELQTASRA